MLSMLGALGEADTPSAAAAAAADGLADPLGTFYRFSLAASLLNHSRRREEV